MNPNDVIDHLAAKLHVPVAHLWGVLVRQAYVNAFEWVLFSALLALALRFAWRRWEKMEDSYDRGTVGALGGGLAAIAILIATIGTIDAIGNLFNPEYYALQQVLDALGGK